MIIRRIQATNALKYKKVELGPLPERGVILVTGPNESGKSTLGELLCMALFGRTYALPADRIERAVRWNARQMDLDVDLVAPGGERWRVHRHIDLDGERGASLHAGEREVTGWEAVTEAIVETLGYDFESFVESFYLARREISPPHPRSETLKTMAGVLPLETTADQLLATVPALEQQSLTLAEEARGIRGLLDEAARDDLLPPRPTAEPGELVEEAEARRQELADARTRIHERMPALRTATDRLVDLFDGAPLARWEARTEALDDALDGVEEAMSWLGYQDTTAGTERLSGFLEKVEAGVVGFRELADTASARRRWIAGMLGKPGSEPVPGSVAEDEDDLADRQGSGRTRLRILDAVALVAVVLAAAGLAMGFLPIERLGEETRLVGRAVGALFALITIGAAWMRSDVAGRLRSLQLEEAELLERRERLEADDRLLDGVAERPIPDAVETLRGLSGGTMKADLDAFAAGPGAPLLREGTKEKLEGAVAVRMQEMEEHLVKLTERIGADIAELETIGGLRRKLVEIAQRRTELAESIATHELGAELATGAARSMTQEFNAEVRQSMVRVLPSLTEGRYQYLQIDDDSLAVRVFSSEKQDFVLFEEISGGTQRQIELATRFALSEAVVRKTNGGPQFLFLDEPFAFFDATRTRASMNALPRLSDQLPQVWIAAQEPPPGGETVLHIALEPGIESLETPA